MHLYGAALSPFVQRVLTAVRAKGQEIELRLPPGGLQSPEFAAISPMRRIPLLALDDGDHICESGAIAGYLDEVLPGPSLLPADPRERARVREIVSIAQGEVGGGGRPLMLHLVFKIGDAPEVVSAARAQLGKGLDAIEALIRDGDRLAVGDSVTDADGMLAPLLTLLEIIDPFAGTAAEIGRRPKVAGYLERARVDPVLGRGMREMREGFAAMMAPRAAPAQDGE